jgi:transport and Golgi organization protein 2
MCTLALFLRQFDDYPIVIAANRDEHFSRPTDAPKIWPSDPAILAGQDLLAGGTWLGVNAAGVAAGIVNRRISTEPNPDARSRGRLCLDMLQGTTIADARAALPYEDAGRYQPFLLLVAGAEDAFASYNSTADIETVGLKAGLHVFSNTSFTDEDGKKLDRARDLFAAAGESITPFLGATGSLDPAVEALRTALSDHTPIENEARGALCVHTPGADYGTVSSAIIFQSTRERRFYFYHAPGPPCRTEFQTMPPLSIA